MKPPAAIRKCTTAAYAVSASRPTHRCTVSCSGSGEHHFFFFEAAFFFGAGAAAFAFFGAGFFSTFGFAALFAAFSGAATRFDADWYMSQRRGTG